MSVHITTGNALDVVYERGSGGKYKLLGLKPHGGEIIPLPEPEGLIESLKMALKDIEDFNK